MTAFLLAALSSSGTGYTSRFSSSIKSYNYYFAKRIGLSTDTPVGYVRLSVPQVLTYTPGSPPA